MNQQPMHERIERDTFKELSENPYNFLLNQPLVQLPSNGVEVMTNITGISLVIWFNMACSVYRRSVSYLIMFSTSSQLLNLL